ncbi:hypothetical protein CVT24_008824 [Panaeolus cyanescens]|uniref:CCHC-type domain-containing protein n=1 Tax=Panaeolus cyanescens TaxID=181874 RepID=A0A409WRJ9_9AGAR|nr:hypothetical protein CVT24_008824 [Panaeolus cyanescens]
MSIARPLSPNIPEVSDSTNNTARIISGWRGPPVDLEDMDASGATSNTGNGATRGARANRGHGSRGRSNRASPVDRNVDPTHTADSQDPDVGSSSNDADEASPGSASSGAGPSGPNPETTVTTGNTSGNDLQAFQALMAEQRRFNTETITLLAQTLAAIAVPQANVAARSPGPRSASPASSESTAAQRPHLTLRPTSKANLPKSFDGTSDGVESFIASCFTNFLLDYEYYNQSDDYKILFALTFMQENEKANEFRLEFLNRMTDAPYEGGWPGFVRALKRRFLLPGREELAANELSDLKQNGLEAEEFFTKFESLRRKAHAMDDKTLILFLKRNVDARIKDVLAIEGSPSTYEDFKTKVCTIDRRIRERVAQAKLEAKQDRESLIRLAGRQGLNFAAFRNDIGFASSRNTTLVPRPAASPAVAPSPAVVSRPQPTSNVPATRTPAGSVQREARRSQAPQAPRGDLSHIVCRNCEVAGHYMRNCPQPLRAGHFVRELFEPYDESGMGGLVEDVLLDVGGGVDEVFGDDGSSFVDVEG